MIRDQGGVWVIRLRGWAHGVYGFLLVVIIGVLIVGYWSLEIVIEN